MKPYMPMFEQVMQFPVAVVCPACREVFSAAGTCSCGKGAKVEMWNGLPRTLFNQNYWGECSKEKMLRVLDAMDRVHWADALQQVVPNESVCRHLLAQVGADFLYGMPWDKIHTVLDIGSGMGFMTVPMARFAEKIVALEAVPERALFLAKRASQDRLDNVFPIIGSASALPFPEESFDLVTMNGVFEYIGLWGKGNPQQLQARLLDNIFRLLKPNGYLYVGIETRFALRAFLGGRDHSGLAFTSLLPRSLASWYCKLCSVPFYGSERISKSYRTYTYTPIQYKKMFQRSGFPVVEVYGLHDGYNHQSAIYPLDSRVGRLVTLDIVDPPASFLGVLRRIIANNRFLFKTVENEVGVFGCKNAMPGRLLWSGVDFQDLITTINTSRKVHLLLFAGGEPRWIAYAGKNMQDQGRFDKANRFLQELEAKSGQEPTALRWPKPCGEQTWHQLHFHLFEYQKGVPLNRLLFPLGHSPSRAKTLISRLVRDYIDLTECMTTRLRGPITAEEREGFIAPLERVCFENTQVQQRVRDACAVFRDRNWPLHTVHGDLSFCNILLHEAGHLVLVDWENVAMAGLTGIDLMRLLGDGWFESEHLSKPHRAEFIEELRQVVSDGLRRLQVESVDFPHIAALFLAHQVRFNRSRDCQEENFEQAFCQGVFRLFG